MVWYGMVWYGMVWYGMVWYGMVWYGMVWYGMVWYGMVWYGVDQGMPWSHCMLLSLKILGCWRIRRHSNCFFWSFCFCFILLRAVTQVQYHEANRFRTAASAAAAGAAPGLNEADRAYRQMVADPSSSIHPMLRYLPDPHLCLTLSNVYVPASVPSA